MKQWIAFSILVLTVAFCRQIEDGISETQDPYAHIDDSTVKELLKKSINTHGGLDRWNSKSSLSYKKYFNLFTKDSTIEKSFDQVHLYQYDDGSYTITSREGEDLVETKIEQGAYSRSVNGVKANVSESTLVKAMNTSLYVIAIPYKLLDPGVQLSYLGVDTLFNGMVGEVIEAAYNPDDSENHSTKDVWRYYFDLDDGRVIANWVQTHDHTNYIINDTFLKKEGILFNGDRTSYRLDSLGNVVYVRADYRYYDYQVAF